MRRGAERLQSLTCDVLSRILVDIAVPNGAPAGRRSPSASWSCSSTLRTGWSMWTGQARRSCGLTTELSLPRHCARHVVCALGWNRRLVGGPGFEPGASRSRTVRTLVQTSRKRSISPRNFEQADVRRPDLADLWSNYDTNCYMH